MTGGSGINPSGSLNTTEQLDPKSLQWNTIFPLPEQSYGHCVVSINATTILIIGGGRLEGSDRTFFFHYDSNGGKYTASFFFLIQYSKVLIFVHNRP